MRLEYAMGLEITESFRWSSYVSPQGYGLNSQTLPKQLRYFLVPDEGRVFVSGDLSQAEARVVAYEADCTDLIEVFNDPSRSVHLENALAFFGYAVEKDSPAYTVSKAGVHGIHYKEGPHRLSVSLGMPVSKTRQLIQGYLKRRPQIPEWHQRVWDTIRSTGRLTNCLGDTRQFHEAASAFSMLGKMLDTHWKDAIAWGPQSVVPHVLNLGLIEIAKLRTGGMDIQFHHQGHDSFLCSVPVGTEPEFFERVSAIYSSIKLVARGGMFGIPQEYTLGYSFGDLVPYRGGVLTRSAWTDVVNLKLQKQSRREQILQGAYGHLLEGWRP